MIIYNILRNITTPKANDMSLKNYVLGSKTVQPFGGNIGK